MKLPFCGSAPHIRPRFRFSFFPANLFVPFEEVDGQSGGKEFVIFKSQRASEDRYLVSVERSKGSRKSSKLVSKERKNVSFPRNHPLGPRPLHQAQARGKESRLIGFNENVRLRTHALEIHSRRVVHIPVQLYKTVDEAPTSFQLRDKSEAPLIVSFGARRVSREVGRSSSNGWIPPSVSGIVPAEERK